MDKELEALVNGTAKLFAQLKELGFSETKDCSTEHAGWQCVFHRDAAPPAPAVNLQLVRTDNCYEVIVNSIPYDGMKRRIGVMDTQEEVLNYVTHAIEKY